MYVPRVGGEYETCIVFLLGYPAMGKRTVGQHLATLLDGVLVDNQLIYRPVVALFRWDGKAALPPGIWDRTVPIREAVLGTIEDLAPPSNNYVFTNCMPDVAASQEEFDQIRSLADRRGSLFLAVVFTCDIEVQVSRIANEDRIALMKGSDPEGYRWHRLNTTLFQPPADVVFHIDTTRVDPGTNAVAIHEELVARGFRAGT